MKQIRFRNGECKNISDGVAKTTVTWNYFQCENFVDRVNEAKLDGMKFSISDVKNTI